MKTRAELYGHEAVGLLRDITMYRVLEKEQLPRLYPGKRGKIENLLAYLTKQGRISFVDGRYRKVFQPRKLCVVVQIDSGCPWHIWLMPRAPSSLSITHHHAGWLSQKHSLPLRHYKVCVLLSPTGIKGNFVEKNLAILLHFSGARPPVKMQSAFIRFLLILQYLILSPSIFPAFLPEYKKIFQ